MINSRRSRLKMRKKFYCLLSLIMAIALLSSPAYALSSKAGQKGQSVYMNTANARLKISLPENVKSFQEKGNSIFYIDGNKLYKINHAELPVAKSCTGVENADGKTTKEVTEDFDFFESTLTQQDIIAMRSGNLTKSDQDMDAMGSVRATLTVTYSQTFLSGDYVPILFLDKATGKTVQLHHEGVIPETSSLHYSATGTVYKNGVRQYNGSLGFTKNYSSPNFTNVQLMPTNMSVQAVSGAGVVYDVACKRGVNLEVNLDFSPA